MALSLAVSNLNKSPNAIELYKGQSKDLEIAIVSETVESGVSSTQAQNLTGATVYFTVRSRPGEPSAMITKSSADPSQISIPSPATAGKAILYIEPSDTAHLNAGMYVFDVWVVLNTGKTYPVIEVSELKILEPVTVIS